MGERVPRMLLLTTDLSHQGRIGTYAAQFAAALRDARPTIPLHVISTYVDPAVAIPDGATVAEVPDHRGFGIAALRHVLRSRPTEVLIMHVRLLPLGLVVARLSGAKLTVAMHDHEMRVGHRRHLRLLGNQVDRVIAASRHTAEQTDRFFYQWVPRRFGQIALVPPSVAQAAYHPRPRGRDTFRATHGFVDDDVVILTVGRPDAADEEQIHDRVLHALAALVTDLPTLKHLIVGVGDDQRRLERLVRDLGLTDVVTFAGSAAQPADCYAAADLLVMPSSRQGFGFENIEALACGVPVVAGGIDGSVESVLYGEIGYLCDPRSRDSLIRAITTALRGSATHDRRSDPMRLRQRAIEAFGPESMAARVDQLLDA